ncbi:MAG: S-layer homology domain-containing protein [Cyanobacteria bacterium]|nr:S-layer homology domain-containing protein [Cyanobacteriota bacterium]
MVQALSNLLYVNPSTGNDSASGSQVTPLKTITKATQQATAGSSIRLMPGTYNAATGEVFPLVVPSNVTVVGDESQKGKGIQITGSGRYLSASFGGQNVTFKLESLSTLKGVTITTNESRGTGIWIESTNPTVVNCTFVNCQREGIFVTGTAKPIVTDCVFFQNAAAGISIVREAKGEYRNNVCQNTGYGIAVGDSAAPLLVGNRIFENRSGIVLSRAARPVLRNNIIERNTETGLVILETCVPDLGNPQEPGGNAIRDNGEVDLQNATNPQITIVSVGNQLNPTRLQGAIELLANEIPPISTNPPIVTPPVTPPKVNPPKVDPPFNPVDPEIIVEPPIDPIIGKPTIAPSDIQGHWAEPFIQSLVNKQFVSGFPDGTFKPETVLTRAQFAAVLAKTFDLPTKRQPSTFADVPSSFWGAAAIAKANSMGFIAGFPDGTFRPGQNLTRVQAIVALVNGLGLTGGALNVLSTYSDRTGIPSYAIESVSTATQRGIVVNYPNLKQLNPNRDMTRAEFAGVMYQALVAINRSLAIASNYIVKPDIGLIQFTDLDSHWAKDFVLSMAMQDYIRGYADGTFQPDVPITRSQFATIAARAINPPPRRTTQSFNDVPNTHWAKDSIDQIVSGGFLVGDASGKFYPDQKMTRLQLVQALVSGLSLSGGNTATLDKLTDRASIPADAQTIVATAIQNRIVVNYPDVNQFTPKREATRAEVVAMINQALSRSGRALAVNSSYILV